MHGDTHTLTYTEIISWKMLFLYRVSLSQKGHAHSTHKYTENHQRWQQRPGSDTSRRMKTKKFREKGYTISERECDGKEIRNTGIQKVVGKPARRREKKLPFDHNRRRKGSQPAMSSIELVLLVFLCLMLQSAGVSLYYMYRNVDRLCMSSSIVCLCDSNVQ